MDTSQKKYSSLSSKKDLKEKINLLRKHQYLCDEDLYQLLLCEDPDILGYLSLQADAVRRQVYGDKVYIRGLIEFTNYCKNDCRYCGIARSCTDVCRYRLTEEEILSCCRKGYALGFRTFVLQGGEDPYWTDDKLTALIAIIRRTFADCAITLSVGERSRESYQRLFDAGADRYLLRHETADSHHYQQLHPAEMNFDKRMQCLADLKAIGFQVGCGFMVGSPGQTTGHILSDLHFITAFKPHMVGIGPFLPAEGTPFSAEPAGSARLTVTILSIIRLLLPQVLLPATTALGTVCKDGRCLALKSGANVIMPNLSPGSVRKKYKIYNNKPAAGDETAEEISRLKASMAQLGYRVVTTRGDYPHSGAPCEK